MASEKSISLVGIFNTFSQKMLPNLLKAGMPNIQTAAVMSSFLNFSRPSRTPPLL